MVPVEAAPAIFSSSCGSSTSPCVLRPRHSESVGAPHGEVPCWEATPPTAGAGASGRLYFGGLNGRQGSLLNPRRTEAAHRSRERHPYPWGCSSVLQVAPCPKRSCHGDLGAASDDLARTGRCRLRSNDIGADSCCALWQSCCRWAKVTLRQACHGQWCSEHGGDACHAEQKLQDVVNALPSTFFGLS